MYSQIKAAAGKGRLYAVRCVSIPYIKWKFCKLQSKQRGSNELVTV